MYHRCTTSLCVTHIRIRVTIQVRVRLQARVRPGILLLAQEGFMLGLRLGYFFELKRYARCYRKPLLYVGLTMRVRVRVRVRGQVQGR